MPSSIPSPEKLMKDQSASWAAGNYLPMEYFLSLHPSIQDDGTAAVDCLWHEKLARDELSAAQRAAYLRQEYARRFPKHEAALARQFECDTIAAAVATNLPVMPGYEIDREIGRGGMAVVYKAKHITTGRDVALKLLLPGMQDDEVLRRFAQEAELGKRLPNVVEVYEFGECNGRFYLALEYVRDSLALRLKREEISFKAGAALIRDVARSLQPLHECGVIHRDLKPANVLLTEKGSPRIADLGLAKDLKHRDDKTVAGRVLGTPNYMSPEQAAGASNEVGVRSDIYSLGAILYEVMTGAPPFRGNTYAETLKKVVLGDFVGPSVVNPGVPAPLETICLKAMDRNPRLRYASAQAFADDLDCYVNDRPIQARRPSLLKRMLTKARLRPWRTAASVGFVCVIFLGLCFLAYRDYRNREQQRLDHEHVQEFAAQQSRHAQAIAIERKELVDTNVQAAISMRNYAPAALAKHHLEAALAAVVKLSDEDRGNDKLRLRVAEVYQNLGIICGEMRENERAEEFLRRSFTICKEVESRHPADPDFLYRRLDAADRLIPFYIRVGRLRQAKQLADENLAECEKAVRESPAHQKLLRYLPEIHLKMGFVLGNTSKAIEHFHLARNRFKALAGVHPDDRVLRRREATALGAAVEILRFHGSWREAEQHGDEALAILDPLANQPQATSDDQAELASIICSLAWLRFQRGDPKEGIRLYAKALAKRRHLAQRDPHHPDLQNALATLLWEIGTKVRDLNQLDQARQHFKEGLEIQDKLAARLPCWQYLQVLGMLHGHLADLEYGQLNAEAGERHYGKAIEAFEAMGKAGPDEVRGKERYAWVLHSWGLDLIGIANASPVLENRAVFSRAVEKLEKSVRLYAEVALTTPSPLVQESLGRTHLYLGVAKADIGNVADAEKEFDASIQMLQPLQKASRLSPEGVQSLRDAIRCAESLRKRKHNDR